MSSLRDFGPYLRDLIARSGYEHQQAFAERVGIHPSQLTRILNGKQAPPGEVVKRMRRHLRLTPPEEEAFILTAGLCHLHSPFLEHFRRLVAQGYGRYTTKKIQAAIDRLATSILDDEEENEPPA